MTFVREVKEGQNKFRKGLMTQVLDLIKTLQGDKCKLIKGSRPIRRRIYGGETTAILTKSNRD